MSGLEKRIARLESAHNRDDVPQIFFLDSEDERTEAKALILAGRNVAAIHSNDGAEYWVNGVLQFSTMGGSPMRWAV